MLIGFMILSEPQALQLGAFGAVATAIVTGGLLWAAIVAGRRLGRQLDVSVQAREDALMPLVLITDLDLDEDGLPTFQYEKIGTGPATGLSISLWVFPRQTPRSPQGTLEAMQREHGERASWGEPHFYSRPPAVGASGQKRAKAVDHVSLADGWRGAHGVYVAWTIAYRDAFRRETEAQLSAVSLASANIPPSPPSPAASAP